MSPLFCTAAATLLRTLFGFTVDDGGDMKCVRKQKKKKSDVDVFFFFLSTLFSFHSIDPLPAACLFLLTFSSGCFTDK